MNIKHLLFYTFILTVLTSCITTKDIKYLQPNENLVINEEGLVPYNIQEYRVTKNDIFNLNIVTTSKGDAAQFYSMFNTSGGINSGNSVNQVYNNNNANDNVRFYFNGIKVDSNGEIYILGIGYLKAEGRTIEDIRNEIQQKVNENFLKDKTDVRLNLDGITYYVLGDIETVGVSGKKTAYTQTLSITEALSLDGGLNRTVDKKDVIIHRRYPEGIKIVKLDLTREDVMNSPYYWIQNGDMIYLNTRKKSLNGFGKDPLNTLTTGVTLLTTALSVYLLISRL
ncbi:polysaccharide biosynthesis/export family protein [Bergeyella cardium]|uniref:Gliding motility protein n=1 Tax=Bergeyella cardium TaxID=1585976 RepID=A0A6P1QWZ4_9FLAO|nr:polysaccharide biosynthesis/export family protein [Bergeyella cardium]QHN65224.1 gliding motility protein [Bergeyella cardium]WHE34540.1 polysaccharide biosynthesis/export family protein [Bergeyella cardium]WHF61191.1 polysaccharide biosynthesis/export family protein [Bergeyella cardium]